MAVTKVSDFGIGDSNLTAMMASINKSYKGKSEITLSNYDNDTAPAVKVGSTFDCNGAIYLVETSDETPSGYSGITNDTMFYLVFDVSALGFVYTETAPTWSDSKQGWYNGNDRYFFSMYKDSGGTLYQQKYLLSQQNNIYYTDIIKSEKGREVSQEIEVRDVTGDSLYTTLSSILVKGSTVIASGFIAGDSGAGGTSNPVYINRIKYLATSNTIEIHGHGPSFTSGSYGGYSFGITRYAVLVPGSSIKWWASIVF